MSARKPPDMTAQKLAYLNKRVEAISDHVMRCDKRVLLVRQTLCAVAGAMREYLKERHHAETR